MNKTKFGKYIDEKDDLAMLNLLTRDGKIKEIIDDALFKRGDALDRANYDGESLDEAEEEELLGDIARFMDSGITGTGSVGPGTIVTVATSTGVTGTDVINNGNRSSYSGNGSSNDTGNGSNNN